MVFFLLAEIDLSIAKPHIDEALLIPKFCNNMQFLVISTSKTEQCQFDKS